MSITGRRVTALMRQIASQDVVDIVHPYARLRTLGALAYIAECYGFRYVDVRRVGENKTLHVYLVRDDAPRAQQRAAANAAAFPRAGGGGAVPGMHPGSLTPVPEAQPHVDLITALITYDSLGAVGDRKRLLTLAWGSAALFPALALLTAKPAVLLPLAVLMPALLLGALRFNTTRRAKLTQRLTAAGCTPFRDEAGRERYVRPVPYAA